MGVRILDRFLDRSQYAIGGGTVLAARWHHRHSTDVDCFIDETTFRSAYESNWEFIMETLREREASGELTVRQQGPQALIMEFTDLGEMSIVSGSNLTRTQESPEYETSTGIRLEPTAEILAKKLVFRVLVGHLKQRDFFDLVVASKCAPKAYQMAMDVLAENERVGLAAILRGQLDHGTLEMGEVKEPYHPRVAEETWELAADLFEGKEIDLPPVPKRSSERERRPDRDDDFEMEL